MTAAPSDSPTLLQSALRAMRRALLFAFVFSFGVNALSLLMPLYSMQVFDRVFSSRSYETLVGLTVIVAIGYVFYGAFYAVRSGIIARVVEWLERTVAPQLLAVSIAHSAQSGVPMAGQHQRDLMTVKNFISTGAPTVMDIPWSLLFILVIFLINPVLGLIAVLGALAMGGLALLNEYATRKALMRATERNVESSLNADTIGRHAEAIQAMGMGRDVVGRWMRFNDYGLALQDTAQQRSAIIMGITRALRMSLQMAVIGIGAVLALNNGISSGGLVACSLLTMRALAPFESTINLWKQFVQARDAYNRLHLLLVTTEPAAGDTTPAGAHRQAQRRGAVLRAEQERHHPARHQLPAGGGGIARHHRPVGGGEIDARQGDGRHLRAHPRPRAARRRRRPPLGARGFRAVCRLPAAAGGILPRQHQAEHRPHAR